MRKDLAAKYDLRVPRYTSYPTAPHFTGTVGPLTYGRWLEELPPRSTLSLYLHIAYCAEMCWFCGCHTKITRRYAPVADYLDALLDETALVAERLPSDVSARHVHFGGGSPTILSADDFERTVSILRERFTIAPDAEIAVELDPRTAERDYVRAMARAGVDRASIGVQDFNGRVQRAINRLQPFEVSRRVTDWLREDGISRINVDLVYGLPHQSADSLVETIDQAMALTPGRISLFGYAHVPWMKKHQRLIDESALPDTDARWVLYETAMTRLAAHGYEAVGLDHFAAPDDPLLRARAAGKLRRNFQGYTTDAADALLGFGASAIGSLPQGYAVNEMDIGAYKRGVRAVELVTRRGVALTDDDRLRRTVIERLMCDMAVDLEGIAEDFGVDVSVFADALDHLALMEADGILRKDAHILTVTEDGRPLVRAVCAAFDRYLERGAQRHSKAV